MIINGVAENIKVHVYAEDVFVFFIKTDAHVCTVEKALNDCKSEYLGKIEGVQRVSDDYIVVYAGLNERIDFTDIFDSTYVLKYGGYRDTEPTFEDSLFAHDVKEIRDEIRESIYDASLYEFDIYLSDYYPGLTMEVKAPSEVDKDMCLELYKNGFLKKLKENKKGLYLKAEKEKELLDLVSEELVL